MKLWLFAFIYVPNARLFLSHCSLSLTYTTSAARPPARLCSSIKGGRGGNKPAELAICAQIGIFAAKWQKGNREFERQLLPAHSVLLHGPAERANIRAIMPLKRSEKSIQAKLAQDGYIPQLQHEF
jgi:hypothetical protein